MAPVFFVASRAFSGRIQQAAERERKLTGEAQRARSRKSLSGQALIQAYNRDTTELRMLHAAGGSWLRARMAQIRLGADLRPCRLPRRDTVRAHGLRCGCLGRLARGAVTLGGLLAFAILLVYLYSPYRAWQDFRCRFLRRPRRASRGS